MQYIATLQDHQKASAILQIVEKIFSDLKLLQKYCNLQRSKLEKIAEKIKTLKIHPKIFRLKKFLIDNLKVV